MKNNWHEKADRLFFTEKLKISEIAVITGVSRRRVSERLRKNEGYEAERKRRMEENAQRRREAKREYDKKRRKTLTDWAVTAETMRIEHDTAARILSYEKF